MLEKTVTVDGKNFVVRIEKIERLGAILKIVKDETGFFNHAGRIRVFISSLRERSPHCALVLGRASFENEQLADKIALELRDEILTLRKKVLAERKREASNVPEDTINTIRGCERGGEHEWKDVVEIEPNLRKFWKELWGEMRCAKCGLSAMKYKCRHCKTRTPHIFSKYLRPADSIRFEGFDLGYLEQWVCVVCLKPKTIRGGGSFARVR